MLEVAEQISAFILENIGRNNLAGDHLTDMADDIHCSLSSFIYRNRTVGLRIAAYVNIEVIIYLKNKKNRQPA